MNLSVRYRRKESIVRREIAGESFLIPICGAPVDMKNIFVLNPLADFIWQRLDGRCALKKVVEEIAGEFDVTVRQAGADAASFIGQLLEKGLVEAQA
jgi:hypothetical protein